MSSSIPRGLRTGIAAAGVVVAGMLLLEVVMAPDATGRGDTLVLFVAMATLTVAASAVVAAAGRRARSLRRSIAAVGLVAVGLVALAVTAGAWRMFFSSHDLRLLAVVLVVAATLGVLFALSVAGSFRADLTALASAASRLDADDLTARAAVDRRDELGAAAAAFDEMAQRLADAEARRAADDRVRRELLAAIGHDLRTPLAALQAAVEALQDGLAPDPDRYLRVMARHVEDLRELVDDLFLLARIEAGELTVVPEPVDLAELADETVEAMGPVARTAEVELRLEVPGQVLVQGGPASLGRVLRNLIDNAIRHAPRASEVVVRVAGDAAVTVEVSDEGPGFPAELLATAFDPFTRAEPSRNRTTGGSGLGLAIARGVVEAHGGRIWAEPGPGGRVGFELPRPTA